MEILFLLIPISLVLVVAAVFAFRWAIKSKQFEDLDTPAMIPLLDDSREEAALRRNRQAQEQSEAQRSE